MAEDLANYYPKNHARCQYVLPIGVPSTSSACLATPRVREYVNLLEEDATGALTFAIQDDFETHIKLES